MLKFTDVLALLDKAVGDAPVGAHHAFWRGLTRDAFVAKRVFGLPLIAEHDGAGSNLIKALKGEAPFGSDIGTPGATMPRMPERRPAVADADIACLSEWIDNGCPE